MLDVQSHFCPDDVLLFVLCYVVFLSEFLSQRWHYHVCALLFASLAIFSFDLHISPTHSLMRCTVLYFFVFHICMFRGSVVAILISVLFLS